MAGGGRDKVLPHVLYLAVLIAVFALGVVLGVAAFAFGAPL